MPIQLEGTPRFRAGCLGISRPVTAQYHFNNNISRPSSTSPARILWKCTPVAICYPASSVPSHATVRSPSALNSSTSVRTRRPATS